jgi:hypothetical protein
LDTKIDGFVLWGDEIFVHLLTPHWERSNLVIKVYILNKRKTFVKASALVCVPKSNWKTCVRRPMVVATITDLFKILPLQKMPSYVVDKID